MTYVLRIKAATPELAEKYRQHSHFHPGDSGIDLFIHAVENKVEQVVFDFGIQCEMVKIKEGEVTPLSYMLFPRSSIVKTPYRMANSIGLIDAAYRGNIKAVVDNKTPDVLPSIGERLFQLVAPNLHPIDKIEVVESLTETSRGSGGFGSTGQS